MRFPSSTRSDRHLRLALSCSSGQGPVRHSDSITQTQSLHSLAGTLGHTPNHKQPRPSLQTRTGATCCGHDRQCLPAPPCKAEALHRAQRARLVSCRKETKVVKGTGYRAPALLFPEPRVWPSRHHPRMGYQYLTAHCPHLPFIHSFIHSFVHSFYLETVSGCLRQEVLIREFVKDTYLPEDSGSAI